MLRCADDSFYIGLTNNLERRLNEHKSGYYPSAYTFERRPVRLVYSKSFHDWRDALAYEKQLKGWSRAKKKALIWEDWEEIRWLAKKLFPL